jgi:hypothetical protein
MLRSRFAAYAAFALACLLLSASAASAQSVKLFSYCRMGPYSGSDYFSDVFAVNVRSSAPTPTGDEKLGALNPLRSGFMKYVNKHYSGYRPMTNATCQLFATLEDAAADKKTQEAEYAKGDYKVIETTWKP